MRQRDNASHVSDQDDDPTIAATETRGRNDAIDARAVEYPDADTEHDLGESDLEPDADDAAPQPKRRSFDWPRLVAFVLLPVIGSALAVAAGWLYWQKSSAHSAGIARIESVAAAKDTTIALLSYKPDSVEKDLSAARDRLTGTFKDSYTQLTHDVVVPGAKQKQVTAVATVPAGASVQATPHHAVVLLYVNQTTTIGTDAPSDSVSVVRVTLDNVQGRWLVSEFDPI